MLKTSRLLVVSAPLRRDFETLRWYDDRALNCVVLTRRGRLLEPIPIFGPARYRLLACKVSATEARTYAAGHEMRHERSTPSIGL
jgi:hypothetical protein